MSRQTLTGSLDVITVTHAASINNLAARTIMGWVKPSVYGFSFGAGDGSLWSRGPGSYMDFLDVALFPANSVYGQIASTGAALSQTNIPNSVPVNTWTHLAMTYDDNGDRKSHFFVNGIESTYDVFIVATGTLADDAAIDLEIGRYHVMEAFTSTAKFYDFRIYNSILTPTELATIVAGGHTVDPQPTHNKCQLTFATDQGATEPDASGNGNTGAITSATFSSDNPSFLPPEPTLPGGDSRQGVAPPVAPAQAPPVAPPVTPSGSFVAVRGPQKSFRQQ
jgi:hypothetical protein